jgi:DNA-binding PadR family transcriptional regulator
MANTHTLTTLEVFLLALIEQGLDTPYRLKQAAGISVGAALPALNRLTDRKFLHRAEVEARNKQEFALTAPGKRALTNETKRLLREFKETPPKDSESALRLAAMAFFVGKPLVAVSLLKSAGETRRRSKGKSEIPAQLLATNMAALYRSMAEVCDTARSEADAGALIALAGQLKRIKIPSSHNG